MLLNQTWVCSVSCSKANLLGCGGKNKNKKKHSIYCRVPSKEHGQLVLKSLEHPDNFQEKDFKNRMKERVLGYLISCGHPLIG